MKKSATKAYIRKSTEVDQSLEMLRTYTRQITTALQGYANAGATRAATLSGLDTVQAAIVAAYSRTTS
jgi:hypothetical protein